MTRRDAGPTSNAVEDFARLKAAIVECLEQIEGKHSEVIASLLTLMFQTVDHPQLLAA